MPTPEAAEGLVESVIDQQRTWALQNGLPMSANRKGFAHRADALFSSRLRDDTYRELKNGRGGELRRLHSFRSSTCLAVNVFEPWRDDPTLLAAALGVWERAELSFESVQPTSISEPHLDVLLEGNDMVVALECKFLELYSLAKNSMSGRYFTAPGMWEGLPSCRALAERLADGSETFEWLDVAQLLKHIAGLQNNYPNRFRLVLVWYRVESPIADQIESEIGRFVRAVSSEIDFVPLTYQDLMDSLRLVTEPIPGYIDYLTDRYRLDGTPRRLPMLDYNYAPLDGISDRIRKVELAQLVDAYHRTVAMSPRRTMRNLSFFVDGHDGRGGSSRRGEKVRARALFNLGVPLSIGPDSVRLLDYEVPLASFSHAEGIGDIDLFGVDHDQRPWLIEVKVSRPNGTVGETPLKALFQVLRYSAMVDANRHAIQRELNGRFGLEDVVWPAKIALFADTGYWNHLDGHVRAGSWLESLEWLSSKLQNDLGIDLVLVNVGDLECTISDGKAVLDRTPSPSVTTSRPI